MTTQSSTLDYLQPGAVTTSASGTVIEILENTPERIKIRRTMPENTGKVPDHFHENGVETFQVIEGSATGSVDQVECRLGPGDLLEIPVGSRHVHPFTSPGETAVVEAWIEPRPEFAQTYFASWLQWLKDGKTDKQDEITFLQVMALLKDGGGGTWVSGPPVPVQKVLGQVLGRVANLTGTKAIQG